MVIASWKTDNSGTHRPCGRDTSIDSFHWVQYLTSDSFSSILDHEAGENYPSQGHNLRSPSSNDASHGIHFKLSVKQTCYMIKVE